MQRQWTTLASHPDRQILMRRNHRRASAGSIMVLISLTVFLVFVHAAGHGDSDLMHSAVPRQQISHPFQLFSQPESSQMSLLAPAAEGLLDRKLAPAQFRYSENQHESCEACFHPVRSETLLYALH